MTLYAVLVTDQDESCPEDDRDPGFAMPDLGTHNEELQIFQSEDEAANSIVYLTRQFPKVFYTVVRLEAV